jgi:hypothetical protein
VSSSGLIYAVIVGLWAAYLVPMWLRRQDELAESGSQDRIFTAVRVLARRPPVGAASGAHRPAPKAASKAASTVARKGGKGAAAGRPSRRRARVLARRRRVVSVLFLSFTAGSALTATYGGLWVGLPATTGVLLSLYIVYLRVQERRRAELRYRRQVQTEMAASRHPLAQPPEGVQVPGHGATAAATWETDGRGSEDPDGWQPVPVPLPTYVTAPVAPGSRMWTPQRPDVERPEPTEPAAVYDQYSDVEDRPRAVND